jgi:hypothetical protein
MTLNKGFGFIRKSFASHAALAPGPVQGPVGTSDSQPPFTTAHPGGGAPFLGIVMDLSF